MASGSESHVAPAPIKTGYGHRKVKAVYCDAVIDEVVNVPQQGTRPSLPFELMQCFGVNAVCHERRTNAMARHVAQEDG